MKQCKDCNEVKPLDAFKRHAETRDGLHSYCKTCGAKKQREYRLRVGNEPTKAYEKTVNGYLVRAYRNMKSRITGIQKKKFYLYAGKELMPKDEFYNWAKSQPSFFSLFEKYKQSGYEQRIAPSVDRIDSSKGYEVGNIRWITHSENSRLGNISRNKRIHKGKVL